MPDIPQAEEVIRTFDTMNSGQATEETRNAELTIDLSSGRLNDLRREAEEAASGNRLDWWYQRSPEEQEQHLLDAAATRDHLVMQEWEAQRPLTVGELAEATRINAVPLMERLGAMWLADLPCDPPPPLLLGYLDPVDHTILFGAGGVGKGVLASWWIKRLVDDGHRVLILDYESHPQEWVWRLGSFGLRAGTEVAWVAPGDRTWKGKRGAIWEQVDDIAALVKAAGITYVVIDSIVPACAGADPMNTEAPSRYASALAAVGVPALSIAHVTKGGDAQSQPFGSAFWHNLARVTWSAVRDGNGPEHHLTLKNCKNNNGVSGRRLDLEVIWAVGAPTEIREVTFAATFETRIARALEQGPLTVREIVEALNEEEPKGNVKADTVRKTLNRGAAATPARFVASDKGGDAAWCFPRQKTLPVLFDRRTNARVPTDVSRVSDPTMTVCPVPVVPCPADERPATGQTDPPPEGRVCPDRVRRPDVAEHVGRALTLPP